MGTPQSNYQRSLFLQHGGIDGLPGLDGASVGASLEESLWWSYSKRPTVSPNAHTGRQPHTGVIEIVR